MKNVDFDSLRKEITRACRPSFDLQQLKHPGESFYTFALISDASVMTVCPRSLGEESYERCVAIDRERWKEADELIIPFEDHCVSYLRWAMAEGVYEDSGQEWGPVDRWIKKATHGKSTKAWLAFKGRFLAAMMLGLKDLDAEGYFGRDVRREGVTLHCGVKDDDSDTWLTYESARRLNPPTVFERFWAQRSRDGLIVKELQAQFRSLGWDYHAFLEHVGAGGL